MKTVEVELTKQVAARLQEAAKKLGITLEELLQVSVEEKLARLDSDFQAAADYVLSKNTELYKRLV
ncbi:MAG TPA: DNA-binding protein [Blastocatellia bacterium]|nr:DNA-binding protein [Blastocatellia bacterium]